MNRHSLALIASLFLVFVNCKDDEVPAPYIDFFSPTEGGPDDEITITGKAFDTNSQVFFNEVPATIKSSSSDNSIVAIVPPNATTGKIKVISNGQVAYSSNDFIVNETKYLVVSMDPNNPDNGIISIFDSFGTLKVIKSFSERFCDVVVHGDKIYAVSIYNSVKILDLFSLEIIKSIRLKTYWGNYNKHIDFAGGKIIVADWAGIPAPSQYFDIESFLKVINPQNEKVDSIPIIMNENISVLTHVNNKIIVAAPRDYLTEAISSFDINSNSRTGQVDSDGFCTDILIDKDDNILAFLSGGTILKLKDSDLSTIERISFDGTNLNNWGMPGSISNSNSYALDKEANVLYYFGSAPQPASAPFVLKSYDLTTYSTKVLNNNFISGSTISFDQRNQLILIGGYSDIPFVRAINIYTTDGVLKSKITVSQTPSEIIVLQ